MKKIILLFKKIEKWLVPESEAEIYVNKQPYAKCKITSISFDRNGKEIFSGICEVKVGKKVEIKNLQDKAEIITKLGAHKNSYIEIKYKKDYRRVKFIGKIALISADYFINNPLIDNTIEVIKEELFDTK